MADDLLRNDLKDQIAKGQVLVIVGAGVSIAATNRAATASWTGLLHDGVERCLAVASPKPKADWAERAHAAIDSGDLDELLGCAEQIERKLRAPDGGEYRAWLREKVGTLRAEDRAVLEALRYLGVPIATTNYDPLISEVTGRRPITWKEHALVERVVRGDEDAVLHLHGYWERPDTVVLGVSSYNEVRGDEHAQTMQQVLASTRTLLFIGCGSGLDDPNFGALRGWMADRFAGSEYRHFRLCRESEADEVRATHSPDERIFPLVYGNSHGDLAPFLRDLRPVAAPVVSTPATPPPCAPAVPLPTKPPRFFGRDALLADLVTTLLSDSPRPTPVLGGPGMGKTTLTRAALHDPGVAAKFGARRYFVRLDGAKTAEAIYSETATILGLPPGPDLPDRVRTALAEAPTLLVLDNAETPWEEDRQGTEDALAQLAGLPGLALVASIRGSSRPFNVGWRDTIDVGRLSSPDARMLFLAVAGRRIAEDNVLDKLLGVLDNVPIAVELMGYAAQSASPAELWQRWQDERTAMLSRGETRLESLAVSYEVSINGLRMTAGAKRLLSMLGLLPDGIAHGDLNALLPGDGLRAAAKLREVGLAFNESARLRVLAPLREHVAARHAPTDDDRKRLIRHYTTLAAEGDKAGRSGGADAIARLIPEVANVEAVVPLGLKGDFWPDAVQAALGFGEFVRFAGYGTPKLLEQAGKSAAGRDREKEAADCIQSLGDIALGRSEHDGARARYEEALPLFRRVGSVLGEANWIKSLGDIALARSDYDRARARYEEALPLFRRVGDVLGEANCIQRLGDIALARSDPDDARAKFMEALALYQRIREPYSIGWAYRRLARLPQSDEGHRAHVEAARAAWLSIKRDDLVAALDEEFPPPA